MVPSRNLRGAERPGPQGETWSRFLNRGWSRRLGPLQTYECSWLTHGPRFRRRSSRCRRRGGARQRPRPGTNACMPSPRACIPQDFTRRNWRSGIYAPVGSIRTVFASLRAFAFVIATSAEHWPSETGERGGSPRPRRHQSLDRLCADDQTPRRIRTASPFTDLWPTCRGAARWLGLASRQTDARGHPPGEQSSCGAR